MTDPRLLFVVRVLHCLSASGGDLEATEVAGLNMVLESIVIDGRGDNEQA
ncbi:hypothetical protein UFOVP1419_19 [uncultured Caudovirales phage]|uniref:Uncharacterized protein n=1 Tax=uncultured Caudovirales phage TaxID=2100421 RepID=A0A6J5SDV0_9CAUD|nr:hypothetical protein UFOVP1419_19 [uncultured Caudovirales phage]